MAYLQFRWQTCQAFFLICRRFGLAGVLALCVTNAGNLARADSDTPPIIAGEWNVKISDQTLSLRIVQKGANLTGEADFASGKRAFDISGSVDKNGLVTLKLFWSRDEADTSVLPEAWAAAVNSRPDPDHPNQLVTEEAVKLSYKEDRDTAGEKLEGDLSVPLIDAQKDTEGHFVKLKSVTDTDTAATIARSYAMRCAAEMGKIPGPINCVSATAELLPITVGGKTQTMPVKYCDKPTQLGQRKDPGQCVPYSRLLRLSNAGHAKVETVVICRRYFASTGPDDPNFYDIAMVSHNPETGHTCFFQAGLQGGTTNIDGSNLPSPTDDPDHKVWRDREADGKGGFGPAGVQCNNCHVVGPFVWSPFVGQAKLINLDRWNPEGKYESNFAHMFNGRTEAFDLTDSGCTSCHRIGNRNNCKSFVPGYTTKKKDNSTSTGEFWMPMVDDYATDKPPHLFAGTLAEFNSDYGDAMKEIAACCDSAADCKSHPQKGD